MRRARNIKKTCQRCGATFYAASGRAMRCEECREVWNKEAQSLYDKQYRAEKKAKSRVAKKSLSQVLRELKVYNEKHGTHLSYGQYINICEGVK